MKKALALVAMLGLVAVASADLEIFFTPASAGYGLSDAAYDFKPTEGTQKDLDFYALKGGNTPATPGSAPNVDVGETAYLWVHFIDDGGAKIQGLDLDVKGATIGENAYYLLDDQKTWYDKRWDGAYTAGAPEFKKNPQVLVGVTAWGIQNKPGMDSLFNVTEHTGLLGAFKFTTAGQTALAELGPLGVSYKGLPAPKVAFTGINVVPEPASLLLLGLAGLLIRRR